VAIAMFSGAALAPGVSRNRRLYTPELIAKAAKRMQERIDDPDGRPIVMRTHHDAGDDSARIVGRVTGVTVDDDRKLRYTAELYNTQYGKDIAALVKPKDGKPALRSVSIHGYWVGDTRQVRTAEGLATTADDLEIDAIDFTASPGVDAALIDGGSEETTESGGVIRTPISEAMEASFTLTEEGSGWADITQNAKEHRMSEDVREYWVQEAKYSADDLKGMASKGHAMKNAKGEPSYPIADIADLKKAIKAVGRGGADHDAIRKHIISRAKALKATNLIPDNWNSDGSTKESQVRLGDVTEYYGDMDSGGGAGFCIDAYAGPLSVTIRGCVSADQLRGAAQAAALAAMDAVNAMDPDADADIDAGREGQESVPDGENVLTESRVLELLEQLRSELTVSEPVVEATDPVDGDTDAGSVSPDDAMEAAPAGSHGHVHDTGGDASHTHGHVHAHENAGGGSYDHAHGHTHFHLPGASESHVHTHDHDHSTASADTHESHIEEESAVSETTQAAEAAPTGLFTPEDKKLLAETIGGIVAEALRAAAEQKDPKHAAPTQETVETGEKVAETAQESVNEKAPDLSALKESLASELRKELRDELRNEFLKENGLPPRRGYRLSENTEEDVQLTDKELFDNHRVELLLGKYAQTPSPDAPVAG
jgi:hypothetical protein